MLLRHEGLLLSNLEYYCFVIQCSGIFQPVDGHRYFPGLYKSAIKKLETFINIQFD